MCHSARVTGFPSVLPGFVQVQPGAYGAGSRSHLIPTDRNDQGKISVLFPSAGEAGDRLEMFITCLKQLEGSYSVIYLKECNIFKYIYLAATEIKHICSACPEYILLESHTQLATTQTQAYFTSKTHKTNKSLLRKYNRSQ